MITFADGRPYLDTVGRVGGGDKDDIVSMEVVVLQLLKFRLQFIIPHEILSKLHCTQQQQKRPAAAALVTAWTAALRMDGGKGDDSAAPSAEEGGWRRRRFC